MESFAVYLLKSTISISVFYMLFRLLMHRETSFAVNRFVILTFIAVSLIIPLVHLPKILKIPVHAELIPDFSENKIQIQNLSVLDETEAYTFQTSSNERDQSTITRTISIQTVMAITYFIGILISFLTLIKNFILVSLIFRKAAVKQMNGYRLFITDKEISSFAFGRSVVISRNDFIQHGYTILEHEQAHIKLNHFYDLILLELIKIFYWFNPLIYGLINDMKEVHEFQADNYILKTGIDSTQYQLLIIQKGVGSKRFALANSFNHCQIKKRITMMNKSKISNAWRWKVATFLPLFVVLLLACSNTGGILKTDGTPGAKISGSTSLEIEGAWKYVSSMQIINGNTIVLVAPGTAYNEMKIWTKGFFAFVGNQGHGGYPFGGSGTYSLNDNLYEESIIYAPNYNPNSSKIKMRLELEKDTLVQIWPADEAGNYDKMNYNIIKMVKMKE